MTKIGLKQIKRDVALSPRVEMKTVNEIAKAYTECFDQMPPITVFKVMDKDKYLLVDGWHRVAAAIRLEREEIEADVKYGSWNDALEFALLSNLKHGLPLTRKEKRYVIGKFLELHPARSNSWIARDLGVHKLTVTAVREELEQGGKLPPLDALYGEDKKVYPRNIVQPKPKPDNETEPEEAGPEPEPEEKEPEPELLPMLGIYELNKVHQADCLMALTGGLPESSIDLVVTDPPYNLGVKYGQGSNDKVPQDEYFKWCMRWFLGVFRVLKPGGSFYVMHYPEIAAQWKQQLDQLFTFKRWLSWVYPNMQGGSKNNWTRSHRTILYYVKGDSAEYFKGKADPQPYKNPDDARTAHKGEDGTTPYDWWEYNLVKNVSKDKESWPNQLPVDLVRRIILSSCPEEGVVCDPFMGSGTAAEAAKRSGRDWVGFDVEKKACEIATERIKRVENDNA